jgi:hypothetical protein
MEADASVPSSAGLPELAAVPWRHPIDKRALRVRELVSATYTAVYCAPLVAAGFVLILIEPLLAPVALISWLHAWIVPELFAYRGARVVFPLPAKAAAGSERVAQGLLGDLLGHDQRALQRRSGLALERGRLGTWLVGEAGAILVRPGGRRVHTFCVRVTDRDLPRSDLIAHLLLALREDEIGFATVANHAFAGAAWRVRRRLSSTERPALAAARATQTTRSPVSDA